MEEGPPDWEATGEPVVADTLLGPEIFVQEEQELTVIVTSSENIIEVRLLMGTAHGELVNP